MHVSGQASRTAARSAVVVLAIAIAGLTAPAAQAVPRSTDFDAGWRFALVNRTAATDPTGAYEHAPDPSYDDSAWRRLDLPHDWSIELTPTPTGGTTAGTGFLQGGLGWYRKTFTLPPALRGKRISLEFDGVYMDSELYLNGHRIGSHAYGYTGFAVDLTRYAHTDGHTPNVLAVKVRNEVPSSRWYSGSGIYRHVHLVVTRPGPRRAPRRVRDHARARPQLPGRPRPRARPHRRGRRRRRHAARARDLHACATRAGASSGRGAPPSGRAPPRSATSASSTPRCGRPRHPRLYTLRTRVVRRGRVLDRTATTFGMRWFRFDPNHGFALNGRPMKLHGRRPAPRSGRARRGHEPRCGGPPDADHEAHGRQRPAHVAQPALARADRRLPGLGIVMMDEAFDTWRTPKVPNDYGRFFDANSDADVKEMVDAAKNSPAVVLWSIGNEIPDSTSPAGVPIAKRLIADVRSIDTSRPIVMGSDKYRSVPEPGSPQDQISSCSTGSGSTTTPRPRSTPCTRATRDTFLFESESSSETSTRGAYQDPEQLNTGENYTPGSRDASSYDNNLASWTMSGEYGLKKDRDRPYFAGEFLWSGMDYIGEPTPYFDVFPVKASFFGAVDTAGFPKDQYYLFQSQWTTRPMVHLLPMDWTRPPARRHRAGLGVRQRRHGRALPQRPLARRAALRPQDDHRR